MKTDHERSYQRDTGAALDSLASIFFPCRSEFQRILSREEMTASASGRREAFRIRQSSIFFRASKSICALLLICASATALGQIGLAGRSSEDWTVLTVATDGSWGTATEPVLNRAIASAIARCRAMSHQWLGCGAYQVSVQGGWALGVRCGNETIIAKGATFAEATESADQRERELRRLYRPDLKACQQLVVVAPDGTARSAEAQGIASGSGFER